MIYGVDTSYANGSCDWDQAAKDEAVKWVYSRACYGSNPADDDGATLIQAHDGCKRNGIPFSAYIFWLAWQAGVDQAKNFLAAANGVFGPNSPVVDVEEGSGLYGWGASLEARIQNLAATLNTIQAKLGQPIIYTNQDTWDNYFGGTDAFSGHRFIIADYSTKPGGKIAIPKGVKTVVAQQFSDGSGQQPILGLSKPDNNVDRDVLLGNDLAVLARP